MGGKLNLKQNLMDSIREDYPLLCNALRHHKGVIVMITTKDDAIEWEILDISTLKETEFADYFSSFALVVNYVKETNSFTPWLHIKLNREYSYEYYRLCEDMHSAYKFLFQYILDNMTLVNIIETLKKVISQANDVNPIDLLDFFKRIRQRVMTIVTPQSMVNTMFYNDVKDKIRKIYASVGVDYDNLEENND